MSGYRTKHFTRAQNGSRESARLDFKSAFDPSSAESWCELVKDIVAFANSGGGAIVFGADDLGAAVGIDPTPILLCDIADVTNRIAKYTGYQFAEIEIATANRNGVQHAVFLIGQVDVPLIFAKPGTYDIGGGKQKTAFSQGTIYFRHGAKSEPGNRDDLMRWLNRAIARVRKEWLAGIRKVVESSEQTAIVVRQSELTNLPHGVRAKISADPSAPSFVPGNPEEFWPYRQKKLLRLVNQALPRNRQINGHDILCVNRKLDVFKTRPDFAFKPHSLSSPQYSKAYLDWLVVEATSERAFFANCREQHRQATAAQTGRHKAANKRGVATRTRVRSSSAFFHGDGSGES
jgi:hypothetical protein